MEFYEELVKLGTIGYSITKEQAEMMDKLGIDYPQDRVIYREAKEETKGE